MAITKAQFQTYLSSAITSRQAGDYAAARGYLADAEMCLAGLALEMSDQGTMLKYRDTLKACREAIDAAEAADASSSSDRADFTRGRCV